MHVSVDYVACKWRYLPIVTLILNKYQHVQFEYEYKYI